MSAIALLDAEAATAALDDLSDILADCVAGGASVNFLLPYTAADARRFWTRAIAGLRAGDAVLLAARHAGRLAGTVMLGLDTPPNQPHRADVKKLLVHRRARRQGLARALMLAAEAEALRRGRTLLTLDTVATSAAAPLYRDLGYVEIGTVPGYSIPPGGGPAETCLFLYRTLARP